MTAQKERAVVMSGYKNGLNKAGLPPLTVDEDEQLVNLFYQARLGAKNDPDAEARQLPQSSCNRREHFSRRNRSPRWTNHTRTS